MEQNREYRAEFRQLPRKYRVVNDSLFNNGAYKLDTLIQKLKLDFFLSLSAKWIKDLSVKCTAIKLQL